VARTLRRRVYLGLAHWGVHENRNAHPALVSEELWHAAQEKVHRYSKKRISEEIALLHGIVRCAGCRFLMSRALNTSGGYRRQYYRCRVHRVSGTCAAPAAIRADRDDGLEAYVEAVVCRELDRRARSYVEVSDSEAMASALAQLDEARDDPGCCTRCGTVERSRGGAARRPT
jgi:recombinase-like zinc beta ribbon protein/recombinase